MNEYAFVALGLGAVCVCLLGVLLCVLAEMRYRGKGTHEVQDCCCGVGAADSSNCNSLPSEAESVLPEQHLRKSTPLHAVRIYRLNIRRLRAGRRGRPGTTLGGWRLQWGGPCRTFSLTWRVADRANW
jgi:hypothetical protein